MTLAKINDFSSITSVGICVFLTVYLALKNALLLLWFLNFGIADSGLCVCLKTTKTPARDDRSGWALVAASGSAALFR